ncbi:uncharacterized protein LOC124535403 [Vanessa cardui]|uniref:uncharacterized protein LOC124535403 n=1 Tax=Vanessa cardui TaxID=171605 RepID=UPI001F138936|nr:uncharacterized protein LOC124535403 [Vanessa cardui]
MERVILGVSLVDKIRNEVICERTKITDIAMVQFRGQLERKDKFASKKLSALSKSIQYFTHSLKLYKAQIEPHVEYCSHLWAGVPQYQLLPFVLFDLLSHLALRRDVRSLCILYRIFHGKCSEVLFGLIPATEFHLLTSRLKVKVSPAPP